MEARKEFTGEYVKLDESTQMIYGDTDLSVIGQVVMILAAMEDGESITINRVR